MVHPTTFFCPRSPFRFCSTPTRPWQGARRGLGTLRCYRPWCNRRKQIELAVPRGLWSEVDAHRGQGGLGCLPTTQVGGRRPLLYSRQLRGTVEFKDATDSGFLTLILDNDGLSREDGIVETPG